MNLVIGLMEKHEHTSGYSTLSSLKSKRQYPDVATSLLLRIVKCRRRSTGAFVYISTDHSHNLSTAITLWIGIINQQSPTHVRQNPTKECPI